MRNLAWVLAVAMAGVGGYLLNGTEAPATRAARPTLAPAGEPAPPRRTSTDAPTPPPEPHADEPATRAQVERRLRELLGEDADPKQVETVVAEVRRLRDRLEAAADRAVQTVTERVAEKVRDERALVREDDTADLLHSIGSKRTRVPSLVADAAAFRDLFTRVTPGPILHGPTGEAPLDGAVMRYPAGVHALDVAAWNRLARFPPDVVVEGAGMDATLLRLNEAIAPRSTVRTLTIRDATIDCNQHYLTDIGDPEPFVMRLERVRVVGFDSGTGRSVMFKVRHGALHAAGCRFEGGYGRAPWSGTLFRVNQALLVRLEDCTLRGPFARLFDIDAGATYHLFRCTLTEMQADVRAAEKEPPAGVTFEQCRFDYRPEQAPATRRSLADLHPDWAR